MATLRIGTRGSQLALWQANHVAGRLRERGHAVEIEIIKTTGDALAEVAFSEVGTKGMFTKEIEEALAAGGIELAVHSLKDLPTELPKGFTLAAIMKREDPRDALVSRRFRNLRELPVGARVGTSSLRRVAQLKAMRPDLEVRPVRGNVDTRLRKLESGEYDAVILAAAGLLRLGKQEAIKQLLSWDEMTPAPGQGALAIEIRGEREDLSRLLAFLDDADSRACTTCERALLAALGGGCQVPIGAYAERVGGKLQLIAKVAQADASRVLTERGEGSDPDRLGKEVGAKLLKSGAADLLRDITSTTTAVPQQP